MITFLVPNAESPRSRIVPLGPQARAVPMACLTWVAARAPGAGLAAAQPRLGDHRRGLRRGDVVICGERPSRSSARLAILACPNEAPCLLVAVDRAQQRVDVHEGALLDARQQRTRARQRHQMRAGHRGELVGMPEGELAQEDPQRRGRIHLVEHPWCAAGAQHVRRRRCSPRRRPSPAMIEVSLPAGFTAPDLTRVDGRSTCSPINSERPVCSASSSTGTNPAADTRFRSSNTAESTVNVCDDCIESAFPNSGQNDLSNSIVPVQKAFSLFTRRSNHRPIHGFRLRTKTGNG